MRAETDGGSTTLSHVSRLLRKHGVELTVLFGVAVFSRLVVAGDAEAVRQTFQSFDWTSLLIVAGLTTGGFAFRFLKWDYYLRRLGIDVPLVTSLLVFVSGLMMVITPIKGGGVWKGWLLKDTENVRISRVVPVVFAECATDLLSLSALAAIGIVPYNRSAVVVGGLIGAFVGIILLVQWRGFCLTVSEWVESFRVIGEYTTPMKIAVRRPVRVVPDSTTCHTC